MTTTPTLDELGITVVDDAITGLWHFTVASQAVEVHPRFGYVKLAGRLHECAELCGLQDPADLNGAPLAAILALLPTPLPAISPEPKPHTPRQPAPPKPPATKHARAARKQEVMKKALSTQDAAAYTGLSRTTLATLRTRGGGPPFVKLGRRVVYRQDDLDAWLAARVRKSTSEN